MLLALGEETTFPDRDLTTILLSGTAAAAILAGAPFEIDLVVDRDAALLDGAIAVGGEEFVAPNARPDPAG